MTTANAARSLAADADANVRMTSDGALCDVTVLTESEKKDRFQEERCSEQAHQCPNQLLVDCDYDDDEEEQRRLDELLTQCHEYIYSQG